MSKKIFLLDTNVLLHDPGSIKRFAPHTVIITLVVLEEIDKKKKLSNELGKNARTALRLIHSLYEQHGTAIHEGIKLEEGGTIRLHSPSSKESKGVTGSTRNQLIQIAKDLQAETKDRVVFISKDLVSRIRAESAGIDSEDYESLKFSFSKIHHGLQIHDVDKHTIDLFCKDRSVELNNTSFFANEYCLMQSKEHSTALAKYHAQDNKFIPPLPLKQDIWGIRPLNIKQQCAFDLLLRDEIKLVTLVGPAGTGKTLLALACGLRKVLDEAVYRKILISRPIIPLGQDIGYLPGTKEEKLQSWMQPLYDNLEYLCGSDNDESNDTLSWVLHSQKIEMEAMTYIRGRTLPEVYIIIDEAQNLTPHEVKTIISRAGQGTKVILAGDPTQIDNPYLDKDSNGLTFAIGKFRDHKLFGHITLDITERSELAALAAAIL